MLLKSVVVVTLLCVMAYANPQLFRSESPLLSRIRKNDLSYRLPNNTRPLHYSLELETDIHKADFDFHGLVTIHVIALEATDLITLQSRQLTINTIELMTRDLEVIDEDADYQQEDDVEFLVVSLPKVLAIGEIIIIRISYSGVLRDDNKGFYYSSYLGPEKTPVYLATTQFESVEARHAFPCFDEPGIRATFDLQIKHDKSYTALSNTRSTGKTPVKDTDYVLTKFQTTPSMQTYLLAFIISDFTFVQNSDEVLRHRVFAKKQSIAAGDGNYALEMGEKLLRKMEEHFGVNYSLPKMDQVAVPDFDAGAMENWGLVTYREEGLLYNTRTTSHTQEYILTTIAHEFAVSPTYFSMNFNINFHDFSINSSEIWCPQSGGVTCG